MTDVLSNTSAPKNKGSGLVDWALTKIADKIIPAAAIPKDKILEGSLFLFNTLIVIGTHAVKNNTVIGNKNSDSVRLKVINSIISSTY